MRRMTAVIAMPMMGSRTGAPAAIARALAITASETYASTRACSPSAISAGLSSSCPAWVRTSAASQLPANPIAPASARIRRWSGVDGGEVVWQEVVGRGWVDQAQDRLIGGHATGDEDGRHDRESR